MKDLYIHDNYDLNTNEQILSFLFLTDGQYHNLTDVQLHCGLCKETSTYVF